MWKYQMRGDTVKLLKTRSKGARNKGIIVGLED
jgi:hypothetical protein